MERRDKIKGDPAIMRSYKDVSRVIAFLRSDFDCEFRHSCAHRHTYRQTDRQLEIVANGERE